MKIYRELYFRGTPSQLSKFAEEISNYVTGDWRFVSKDANGEYKKYLFFDYMGKKVDNARVSIYLGDRIDSGEVNVGNIIPLKKSHLSIEEYNAVLMLFYKEIVVPYEKENSYLSISQPTDDNFNPLTIMSEASLKKLKAF